jgi:hypothetical protein
MFDAPPPGDANFAVNLVKLLNAIEPPTLTIADRAQISEATSERKFAHGNKRIRRRPDLVFFVSAITTSIAN